MPMSLIYTFIGPLFLPSSVVIQLVMYYLQKLKLKTIIMRYLKTDIATSRACLSVCLSVPCLQ